MNDESAKSSEQVYFHSLSSRRPSGQRPPATSTAAPLGSRIALLLRALGAAVFVYVLGTSEMPYADCTDTDPRSDLYPDILHWRV